MTKRNRRWAGGILALSFLASSSPAASPPTCSIRLADVTPQSGITFRHSHGGDGQKYLAEFMVAGLALFDYDGDGWIDIYFLNGAPLQGTIAVTPPRNALYRNNGDWTFTDVTQSAGVGDTGHALGVVVGDYDHDGDLDLYINNFGPNVFYRNEGDGTFSDVTHQLQLDAGDHFGAGTCFLDIEGDGDLDLYVANYVAFTYARHAQLIPNAFPYPPGPMDFPPVPDALFRNNGDGFFDDVSSSARLARAAFTHTKWGSGLVDFDNDGDRDLFIACGHFLENIREIDDTTDYRVPNILLMNAGDGTFRDVSPWCGDALAVVDSSRGVGFDDLDNDGDVDGVVLNANSQPTIVRNDSAPGPRWLQIRLRGVRTNRDGVGARVRVAAGDLVQVAEVHAGRGYQSHFGTQLYFGLRDRVRVDRVEVRWVGGGVDVFSDLAADQRLVLIEGTGQSGP